MKCSKATAVAIGVFMLVLPSASIVGAEGSGHEEGDPMIVTVPAAGESISCAVYFADNMVFAPQWRTGNLVRIEMMVIDMAASITDPMDPIDPRSIDNSTINLPISFFQDESHPEYADYLTYDEAGEISGTDQQRFLLDDSDRLSLTSMVSVSYMCVNITGVEEADGYWEEFEAGWLSAYPYERVIFSKPGLSELGREVNQHGNLIYGMSWDTSNAPEGPYRVDVQLGKVVFDDITGEYVGDTTAWYTVDFAIGHLYIGDGVLLNDDRPYVSLVPDEGADTQIDIGPEGEPNLVYLYADLGIGLGGISSDNTAWVLLGPLIGQGPGGGNGGDSGGTGGGWCGENPHD